MAYRPERITAVVQEDVTGYGIACVAAVASRTYPQDKNMPRKILEQSNSDGVLR